MSRNRPAALCVVGTHPASWQASVLCSPKLFNSVATLAPQAQKEETAWCFKLLLREGRTRVYVQERREVVHIQKEMAPTFSSRD